ncbi:MAG: efflux RND transporter permease subunit, partial [Spirochaetota bacterium]|nr:efflux RND transporter permease subunit [Spirochaetota bacterium]
VLAVASALRINRLGYPRVDFDRVTITTQYPGASPEDVELNVTINLEEALEEVDGIEKYISKSIENVSVIDVYIESDIDDKDKVKSDIRRAVDRVIDLPDEVKDKPYVFEHKMDNYGIYEIALTMPKGNEKKLRFYAKELKKKLIDLDPVSRITERGIRDREFKILLNRDKMRRNHVSFDEVINSIKQNKLRLSGGFVESYTNEKGIVTFSEFSNPKDIENIIVRTSEIGAYKIRIGDIGKVVDRFEKREIIVRYNGQEGMSLWVTKKSSADIISTVEEIKSLVKKYKENFANNGLNIFSTYDDSIETKKRLSIVYNNAIAGFVLVIIMLFLFLDRQIALWTAIGIPTSIAITLIILPLLDITINSISLCGFVVVLGMIVDDAIIISESISRARENGMSPVEASLYGLKIVVQPVLGTIITTIIAFIPIYFVPGMIGDFSIEIPSIVIIMLIAGFFEASILLPIHLAHSNQKILHNSGIPIGQRFLNHLEKGYVSLLNKALKFRYLSLIFLIIFLGIGGGISVGFTNFNMFPVDQAYKIWISGNSPKVSNLENTARETLKLEAVLDSLPKGVLQSYRTVIGRKFNDNVLSSNSFYMSIILTPSTTREMKAQDVKAFIQHEMKKRNIRTIYNLDIFIDGGGPPVGRPLEIRIIGNDNQKRKKIIDEMIDSLQEYHVTEIEKNLQEGKEEIKVLPNHDAIAIAKLNVGSIASTIRTAIDGAVVTNHHTPEDKIPFRVMLDEDSKNFWDPLHGLYVRNPMGNLIPIKSLVFEKKDFSPQNIFHYNGDRSNMITGNIKLEKTTPKEVYEKLKDKYKNFSNLYPGFKMIIGGEAKESTKIYYHMIVSIIIAVIAIYFILVIQFNSFIQPVMVIMAIPFGLIGLMLAFTLHGMDISMLAMVGILGFSGVVVNDSLIMVEFINRIITGNKTVVSNSKNDLNNAVIQGAKVRLRPVVLTTVTTIAGLLPTAYGIIGGLDNFISPMVMAMTWGLLIGTSATLLAIPIFYLFIYHLRNRIE